MRILSEFRTRYVVSYTPRGAPKPGWHRLEVRVNVPGASVTARPGITDRSGDRAKGSVDERCGVPVSCD